MAEAGELQVKKEKEDWMEYSDGNDASGSNVNEIYIKTEAEELEEDLEDIPSEEQIHEPQVFIKEENDNFENEDGKEESEGQINQIFVKVEKDEEGLRYEDGDERNTPGTHFQLLKTEEIDIQEDPLELDKMDEMESEEFKDGPFDTEEVELAEGEKDEEMLDSQFMVENLINNSSQMSMKKLIRLMARKKDFLCYLICKGLLRRDPPCYICGQPMILTIRDNRCIQDYRCHKETPAKHRTTVSVLRDSWFSSTRFTMDKVMLLTYMFAHGFTDPETLVRETSTRECNTAKTTVLDWLHYCREVTLDWCVKNQSKGKIGGKGVVVEIEEAKMGKRKARGGRKEGLADGSWVIGLTEEKMGNCGEFRIVITTNRNPQILLPYLEKLVNLGTVIVYNHSKASYCLTKTGFRRATVSENRLVELGAEGSGSNPEWKSMKGKGRKKTESVIHENLWRRHVKASGVDPFEHFIFCIKDLYKLDD